VKRQYTVHIISHTHWDREWFLNSPFVNEWLVEFFSSLFAMLEKEPEYRFVLDGQTLMMEDYLNEVKRRGQDREACLRRLRDYIREGRLLAGPYYLQPDWQLVSGESLIRNLQIGRRTARRLGGCLQVGWLLDNFGQISQAVQIHSAFGMEGLFLWRGVEMDPEKVRSEFLWESPDGSVLPAVYLLDSYRNAMRLCEHPDLFAERISSEVEKLKPFASTSNILLMNGYDQEMVPDDILPHIRRAAIEGLHLRQSTPGEFFDAVGKEKPALPRLKGWLYSGRFISVFPGVLSSRMYLKLMNHHCQRLLETYTEPLSAFSWILGSEQVDDFESLWKMLLQNHPHDSICGVGIDDVHSDMERRFEAVAGEAAALIRRNVEQLSARIDTGGSKDEEVFLVLNPCPYARDEIVTIEGGADDRAASVVENGRELPLEVQRGAGGRLHVRLREIPACGYTTLRLIGRATRRPERKSGTGGENEAVEVLHVEEGDRRVENSCFVLRVLSDGSLELFDKASGATYRGLGAVEDCGDAGDTYTYSPPPRDSTVSSSGARAEVDFIEKGPLLCVVRIKIELELPEALDQDRQARSCRRRLLPIITFLEIEAGSPLIRFKTVLSNTVKDHRLRVLFPSGIDTPSSFAETQFDVVKRPIHPPPYEEGSIGEELKRVLIGAREPQPVSTFPQGSFVDLSDGERGLAVINAGLPEYEVIGPDNTLAVTLFRSVGWLARGGLLSRTGDAGPQIFTPDAQCLREMTFGYALCVHRGGWLEGRVHRLAEKFNDECLVFRAAAHSGTMPSRAGLLSLESSPEAVRMSALKRSEDGQTLVLRCYNPASEPAEARIAVDQGIKTAFYANMDEKATERIELSGSNRVDLRIGAKKILTLLLEPNRQGSLANIPAESGAEAQWLRAAPPHLDFTSYPAVPMIDRADIEREEQRRAELGQELEDARARAGVLERQIRQGERRDQSGAQRELELIRSEIATLERQCLEGELSLLLTKKKWNELKTGEERIRPFDKETVAGLIREIGLKLNRARIKKRTYDYVAEYLRHDSSNRRRENWKKKRGK
jgi:mannosylglycerate hydrolase